MPVLTRFCPGCYARCAWDATRCEGCGRDLREDDSYDERLMWALDHPDTSTAMLAADLLARRGTSAAVERLIATLDAPDPYRAAAAARALTAFDDEHARAAVRACRTHRSAMVRRAVGAEHESGAEGPTGLAGPAEDVAAGHGR